jgi:DNA-binding transcriptional ArsR family regulator
VPIQIRFGPEDLTRIRISRHADPMWELQNAARRQALGAMDAVFGVWSRRAANTLGSRGVRLVRQLQAPVIQVAGLGAGWSERGWSFDEQLEDVLSRPQAHWRLLADLLAAGGFRVSSDLANGGVTALNALDRSLRTFFDSVIAPSWESMAASAATATTGWAGVLAMQGVEVLLNSLHPNVSWAPPFLRVAQTASRAPGCVDSAIVAPAAPRLSSTVREEGLMIVPALFMGDPQVHHQPVGAGMAATALVIPVPARTWRSFEPVTSTSDTADILAQLLGSTRSWVLTSCQHDGLTTTEVARRLGISASSASEHASVLRSAGLLESYRRGHSVIHRTTALGDALITSSRIAPPSPPTIGR